MVPQEIDKVVLKQTFLCILSRQSASGRVMSGSHTVGIDEGKGRDAMTKAHVVSAGPEVAGSLQAKHFSRAFYIS